MINLQQNTLLREIPPNLLVDDKVAHLATALQQSLDDMLEWSLKINYTINLENVDDEILDYLLLEKSIGWSEGLSLSTTRQHKINLIQSAIELHRTKGTPYALERVLEALNLPGEVIEWNQYNGAPYTFKIEVELVEIKGNTMELLYNLIEEYKNERSWLDDIAIRFPRQQLNLTEIQYHYPVYYPIAKYHWTEGVPGARLESSLEMDSTPYHYPVYYPVANDYEVEGIKGEVTKQDTTLIHTAAGLVNPYPICGTFFGGGY